MEKEDAPLRDCKTDGSRFPRECSRDTLRPTLKGGLDVEEGMCGFSIGWEMDVEVLKEEKWEGGSREEGRTPSILKIDHPSLDADGEDESSLEVLFIIKARL